MVIPATSKPPHPYQYMERILRELGTERTKSIRAQNIVTPTQLELHLVPGCLNSCWFCPSQLPAEKHYNTPPLNKRELTQLFADIQAEIPKMLLSGGVLKSDPLLSPHLPWVIEQGRLGRMVLGLYTVGGKKLTAEIAALFSEGSLPDDYVALNYGSFDEESYNKIYNPRGDLTGHEIVLASIARLTQARARNGLFRIAVNYVLTDLSYNSAKTEEQVKRLKDVGIDRLRFVSVVEANHTKGLLLTSKDLLYAAACELEAKYSSVGFDVYVSKSVDPSQKDFSRCRAHLFKAVIANNGHLAACVYNKDLFFGNLHSESFWAAWHGEQHRQLIKMLDINNCPPCCIADNEINTYFDHERVV